MSGERPDKLALLEAGKKVMVEFCALNALQPPDVVAVHPAEWHVNSCAYYRASITRLCLSRCAAIGVAGMAWSYPGYTVDRTPYGVVQHELGHHVDVLKGNRKGAYWSDFSAVVRGFAGEKQITSYCPNDAEWFAEMFRVFVTNPDLLKAVRPRTYSQMRRAGLTPIFSDTWRDRLADAPARTIAAAARQVEAAAGSGSLL